VKTLSAMGTVSHCNASTVTAQTAMVVVLIRLLHRALKGVPVTNVMCPTNPITTLLALPK